MINQMYWWYISKERPPNANKVVIVKLWIWYGYEVEPEYDYVDRYQLCSERRATFNQILKNRD